MLKKLKNFVFIHTIVLTVSFLLCPPCALSAQSIPNYMKPMIMVLSLSSDGHYAVSTDGYQHAVLWNLKRHTSKIIAKDVNIYSAYFIRHTNDYMYQDNINNRVYIRNVAGKIVKVIQPGFATYGQAMFHDLKTYIGVDSNDQIYVIHNGLKHQLLYHYCGPAYKDEGRIPPAGAPSTCGSFMGDSKLFNLSISHHGKFFINSGFSEIYLWNLQAQKLIHHMTSNNAQTFATLSPDGRYIVSVDQQFGMFKYDIIKKKLIKGRFLLIPEQLPLEPIHYKGVANGILSTKFIDRKHFLVFYFGVNRIFPFAGLFSINAKAKHHKVNNFYTINPIKYLPLLKPGKKHQPQPFVTDDFSRDQAIDTSPSAHVLVMAMAKKNGILVYHYNPKTQRLKQVWAGVVKSPKRWWHVW